MNYRTLPDAPESAKYHGGYDPSDPPLDDQDGLSPQEQEENYLADLEEARFKEQDL